MACTPTINIARQFTAANTEYFTTADHADWKLNQNWAMHCWAYFDVLTGFPMILGKDGGAGGTEFSVYTTTSDLKFEVITDTIVAVALTPNTATAWHSVYVQYRTSDNQIHISLDDGTPATAIEGNPVVSDGTFQIGARAGSFPMDGRIQQMLVWAGSLPSAADVTALHNAGSGGDYRNISLSVSPTHAYPLNEVSGDALDTQGAIDLTDTNTVTNAASLFSSCAAAGGTLFFQTNAGAASFGGTIAKTPAKLLAGAAGFAGALAKSSAVSFAGVWTGAGTLAKRAGKALAGAASFAGAVSGVKTALKSIAGALSFAGGPAKLTGKPVSGALTASGGAAKTTAKFHAGALSFSGAAAGVKTALVALAGAVSFAGAATLRTGKSLAGSMDAAGALAKRTAKTFAGALDFSGAASAVRQFVQAVAGALSFAGVVSRRGGKSLAGSLDSSGAVSKAVSVSAAGVMSFTGAVVRRTAKTLAGALSFAGAAAGLLSSQIKKIALTLQSRSAALTLQARSALLTLLDRD